jgi:hypothetical protein
MLVESNFVAAFEGQRAAIENHIALANSELQAEESRDNSERIRTRIRYLSRLLELVRKTQFEIIMAASDVNAMDERYQRWIGIRDEARSFKEQMDQAEYEYEAVKEAVVPKENSMREAEYELHEYQAQPLPMYATEKEKRLKTEGEQKLRAALEDAQANYRDAKGKWEQVRGRWMEARDRFNDAAWRERQARLPGDPEPHRGVGQLSAVR